MGIGCSLGLLLEFSLNSCLSVSTLYRMAFPDILDLNRFNDVLANGEIFEQLGDAGGLRSCKKFDAVGPAFGATGDSGDEGNVLYLITFVLSHIQVCQ